jgi:hypothetical protein
MISYLDGSESLNSNCLREIDEKALIDLGSLVFHLDIPALQIIVNSELCRRVMDEGSIPNRVMLVHASMICHKHDPVRQILRDSAMHSLCSLSTTKDVVPLSKHFRDQANLSEAEMQSFMWLGETKADFEDHLSLHDLPSLSRGFLPTGRAITDKKALDEIIGNINLAIERGALDPNVFFTYIEGNAEDLGIRFNFMKARGYLHSSITLPVPRPEHQSGESGESESSIIQSTTQDAAPTQTSSLSSTPAKEPKEKAINRKSSKDVSKGTSERPRKLDEDKDETTRGSPGPKPTPTPVPTPAQLSLPASPTIQIDDCVGARRSFNLKDITIFCPRFSQVLARRPNAIIKAHRFKLSTVAYFFDFCKADHSTPFDWGTASLQERIDVAVLAEEVGVVTGVLDLLLAELRPVFEGRTLNLTIMEHVFRRTKDGARSGSVASAGPLWRVREWFAGAMHYVLVCNGETVGTHAHALIMNGLPDVDANAQLDMQIALEKANGKFGGSEGVDAHRFKGLQWEIEGGSGPGAKYRGGR